MIQVKELLQGSKEENAMFGAQRKEGTLEENEVREVGRDQIQVLCERDAAAAAD